MTLNRFWWALGLVLVSAAVFICLVPGDEIPEAIEFNDKLSHIGGHAAMAAYFTGLVARGGWWKIFLALLLLGIGIEFAQGAMHFGRAGDPRDVLANCSGAALGLLFGWLGLSRWTEWAARLLGQRVAQ